MECRAPGSLTVTSPAPPLVLALRPLINAWYNASCRKSPDRANDTAYHADGHGWIAAEGQRAVRHPSRFRPWAAAVQRTTSAVGNKYRYQRGQEHRPFNGDVPRAVYCSGLTDSVRACLAAPLHTS